MTNEPLLHSEASSPHRSQKNPI